MQYEDLLLFTKEMQSYPRAYLVYFASMRTGRETPAVLRLACGQKLFESLRVGFAYSITVSGYFLKAASETGEVEISQGDFERLMAQKAYESKELWELRSLERKRIPLYNPVGCYTFKEQKEILSYSEPPLMSLFKLFIQAALNFFAVMLPVGIFTLITINSFSSDISTDSPGKVAGLILKLVTALPLLLCVTSFLLGAVELLLFRWRFTCYALTKRHVLLQNGEHKAVNLTRERLSRWLIFGGAAIAALVFGLLIAPALSGVLR